MTGLPGGPIAKRPLHFFWVCDCSGSMLGDKIESLNRAIHDALGPTKSIAEKNPHTDVFVNVLTFAQGYQWIHRNHPLQSFQWPDLQVARGDPTDLGAALHALAAVLETPPMPKRGLRPVIVLVSDGMPSDDFQGGLQAVLHSKWGQKAIRLSIGIGGDVDETALAHFIGNSEIPVLRARNSDQLTRFIRWASTTALGASSAAAAPSDPVLSAIPASDSSGPEIWT